MLLKHINHNLIDWEEEGGKKEGKKRKKIRRNREAGPALCRSSIRSTQGTSGAAPRSCRAEPRAPPSAEQQRPLAAAAPRRRLRPAPRRSAPPDGPVRADPGGTALSAWETSEGTKKEEEGATRGFPARTLEREEERQAGTDGTRAAPPPLPGLQRGCVPKPSSPDSGCRSDLLASPRGPVPQPAQGEQRLHRLQKKPAVQALVAPLRSHVHSGEQAALPSGRNFAFLSSVSTPEPG